MSRWLLLVALLSCAGPRVVATAVAPDDPIDRELLGSLSIVDDPEVRAYVRAVGQRVARCAGNAQLQFDVIDQPSLINAFALPNGHVYLFSGLLLRMSDEAQLAGVLGHEIAHEIKDVPLGLPAPPDSEFVADFFAVGCLLRNGYDPHRVVVLLKTLVERDHLLRFLDHPELSRRRVRILVLLRLLGEPRGVTGRAAYRRMRDRLRRYYAARGVRVS